MVVALLSYSGKTYSFNYLCRLNASGTSFDTSKAGKTLVKGVTVQKRLNVARFNHINELMRVKFHLIIGGTSSRAFAAAHTFANVYAAYAENFFFSIHYPASLVIFNAESLCKKLCEIVNRHVTVVLVKVVHTERTGCDHHFCLEARSA